jgi:ribosomal protein S6
MSKSFFEQNGGTYSEVNGYRIPNLTLPDDGLGEEVHIGIWGQRRLDYLKKHRKGFYTTLLTNGKLRTHLHEIDVTANERWELIIKQMMKAQGITEQLKAEDGMKWVGMVNNIRACADEVIRSELIYN